MSIRGPFQVKMTAEPPYETVEGVTLSRARFDKTFSGPLTASSVVNMLAVRTPEAGSAGYVATERIEGTLEGKRGSFVVMHTGVMDRGTQSLSIVIVAGSGTGELAGISGRMTVEILEGGAHFYQIEYALSAPADRAP
jgi:hypothetical protein